MSYELDAELAPAMAALAAKAAQAPVPARGDWQAVRTASAAGLAYMDTLTPASAGVTITSFFTPASDGDGEIELRWYTKTSAVPGPAVVYAYAAGLAKAGVPVELHVHPGAPHGFERFVPDAGVASRAMADRARAVAAI